MTLSNQSSSPDQKSQVELTPEAKKALAGHKPEAVWLEILSQVAGAVDEQYDKAEAAAQQEGLEMPVSRLQTILGTMIPEDGLNLLVSVRPHLDLTKVSQQNPLTILRGVAEIFTRSDEMASREGD